MATEPVAEEKELSRVYEVAYLVAPNVPEDKVAEEVTSIKSLLETNGAFVLSDEFPRFRQLAYTLAKSLGGKNAKFSNAYFGWVKFEAGAAKLQDIKEGLSREANLVRFLVVKVDRESRRPMRAPVWRGREVKHEAPKTEKAPAVSEAELDKTIEELLVE